MIDWFAAKIFKEEESVGGDFVSLNDYDTNCFRLNEMKKEIAFP